MDENSDESDKKMHDPILNTDSCENVSEENNIDTVNLVNKESATENAHSTSETSEIDPAVEIADKNSQTEKNSELDSDSSDVEDRNNINFQEFVKKKAAARLRILVDSDSEDDEPKKLNSVTISSSTQASPIKSKTKSRLRINSDSSDDSPRKNQINDDKSDSDEDLAAVNRSKRLNELVDSDSEDEIVSKSVGPRILADSDDEKEEIGKPKKAKKEKKRTGSKRSAKDEAMKQIHSETQRLLREAPVSLPYHRPRQRTLEEFLNRKKIAPVLPQATSTFARMKMSAEIVSRALEEKEREAELFYKSESDEDSGDAAADAGHVEADGHGVALREDSQALSEEKSDGIHQDAVKHVTRQLFNDDSSESLGVKSQSISSGVISLSSGSDDKLLKESSCENNLESIREDEKLADSQEGVILSKESNEFSSFESADPAILDAVKIISNLKSTSTESETDTIVLSSENDKTETEGSKCDDNFELRDLNLQSDKSDGKELDKCEAFSGKINCVENVRLNAVKSTENISSLSSISKKSIIDEPDLFCNGSQPGNSEPVSDEVKEVERNVPVPTVDKKKTLMNFAELKPKIRGAPGMMIDFTREMKPNKEAIDNLLDRFLSKHAGSKPSHVNTEVTVLQTEATDTGLKVTKDVLAYKNVASNVNDPELNKPGAKLVRLKEDLKKQMADKRHEEWMRKEQDVVDDDEEEEEEEDDEGEEKNKGDKEVEEEIMDIDEEEEELEEDDVPMKDKRISCDFGDDEAELSEEDQIHVSDDEDEDDGDEEDDNEDEEEENTQGRKRFSRIVALDEDSNSDTENSKPERAFKRTRTDVDIFEDFDDLEIPAGQRKSSSSPETVQLRETLSSVVGSISTQGIPESPVRSLPSQLNDWDIECTPSITESPGKLFEVQSKPVTDEELMNLCSGKFTDGNNTQASNPRLSGLIDHSANEKPITDSQIINLCSGTFTSPDYGSQSVVNNVDESSQDMCLRFDENSQNGVEPVKKKVEEILKEKEKEGEEKKKEILRAPLKIVSSSSEDDDVDEVDGSKSKKKVLTKKKIKKLVLSDDEDEDNFTDEEQGDQSDEEKFIDYDSEENEVVVVPKREIKKVAANFLEAEAELSESEWGSEDEDEKGLDKFEIEEGDAEDIDEDQMKDQLGKIHARQLLDDDQRDVRMLQELLFEDGDLHTDGSGRERRFKWKNIDKIGDDFLEGPKNDEDDDNPADPNELANEIEWRKMRLEREKFLEEKMKSMDDSLENELGLGGQFFKLGMKVVKKRKISIEQQSVEGVVDKPIIPRAVTELMGTPVSEKSKLLHNAMKRGSFLARGDEALAKLAQVIKQSDNALTSNHSKHFLFTHLSPSVDDSKGKVADTDAENVETDDQKGRKRKSAASDTPKLTKKTKLENPSSKKKLF